MKLTPCTMATIRELGESDWLCRVGTPLLKNNELILTPIQTVNSWSDAFAYAAQDDWDLVLEVTGNGFSEAISKKNPYAFKLWNVRVRAIKEFSIPLVKEKLEKVPATHVLFKGLENTLLWIVLHICMEAEHRKVIEPGFYASLGFWLVNGHIPCGWKGEFPNGKLVIY